MSAGPTRGAGALARSCASAAWPGGPCGRDGFYDAGDPISASAAEIESASAAYNADVGSALCAAIHATEAQLAVPLVAACMGLSGPISFARRPRNALKEVSQAFRRPEPSMVVALRIRSIAGPRFTAAVGARRCGPGSGRAGGRANRRLALGDAGRDIWTRPRGHRRGSFQDRAGTLNASTHGRARSAAFGLGKLDHLTKARGWAVGASPTVHHSQPATGRGGLLNGSAPKRTASGARYRNGLVRTVSGG